MLTKIRRYLANKIYNFENERSLVDAQANFICSLLDHLTKINNTVTEIIPSLVEMNKTLREELLLSHKALLKSEVEKTEEELINEEISSQMKENPIPYLIEMLNTDICHTMNELYDPKHNSQHPIEWSPKIYYLSDNLVKDLIKLLTSKDKIEIIEIFNYIVENSDHNILLDFYRDVQTKASNKIITTLMNLIANESLK